MPFAGLGKEPLLLGTMMQDCTNRRPEPARRRISGRAGRRLASLLSGTALALLGSAASAETLREAWTKAYYSNPTLEAQRAQLRATDERVNQALSGWRPTVQAGATAGIATQDSNLVLAGSQTLYPKTLSLSLRQPIYRGGRTTALTSRAERDVETQRARLVAAEQQLMLDVAVAYMAVLRDQAVLELNRYNERVITRQLEAARDRFSVGEVTRTDVAQAEARLARALADRIQAEGNLEVSRTAYERLVGEPPGALAPPTLPQDLPASRDQAIAVALEGNPTVFAAQFAALSAQDNIRAVRGELYPTVNLNAGLSRDYDRTTSGSRVDLASLAAELTVPLYQAGAVASRVREAKEVAGQALTQIEEARRAAIESATESWENLTTARARIQSLQTQIAAAEIALEGVQQEALVGTRTVLDVLDAEQELLDARVNLVVSQRDFAVATLSLAAAIGTLTAERLQLPVDYYDPNVHYEYVRNKWWGTDPTPPVNSR